MQPHVTLIHLQQFQAVRILHYRLLFRCVPSYRATLPRRLAARIPPAPPTFLAPSCSFTRKSSSTPSSTSSSAVDTPRAISRDTRVPGPCISSHSLANRQCTQLVTVPPHSLAQQPLRRRTTVHAHTHPPHNSSAPLASRKHSPSKHCAFLIKPLPTPSHPQLKSHRYRAHNRSYVEIHIGAEHSPDLANHASVAQSTVVAQFTAYVLNSCLTNSNEILRNNHISSCRCIQHGLESWISSIPPSLEHPVVRCCTVPHENTERLNCFPVPNTFLHAERKPC